MQLLGSLSSNRSSTISPFVLNLGNKSIIDSDSTSLLHDSPAVAAAVSPDVKSASLPKPVKKSKLTMDVLGFRNISKVIIGDLQILIASFLFGFGFIGQRAVSVDGLGPMTCNAFRFTASAILILIFLPLSNNPSFMRWINAKLQRIFHYTRSISPSSNSGTSSTSGERDREIELSGGNPSGHVSDSKGKSFHLIEDDPYQKAGSDDDDFVDGDYYDTESASLLSKDGLSSTNNSPNPTANNTSNNNSHNSSGLWNHIPCYSVLNTFLPKKEVDNLKRNIYFWGIYLGLINFLGSGFQQWGIFYTSANKVAFISGFDLFFTPMLTFLIPTLKHNSELSFNIWMAVVMSIFGLYLLSDASIADFSMGHGELLAMVSALFWSLHIIYSDMATAYIDSVYMIAIQSLIVGVFSGVMALATESMPWFWYHFFLVFPWLLCLSLIEALGLVFMIKGQKYSPPTHAAIITSLEGVFASVGSYMFLGETLSSRELVGCCLMLGAAIITEVQCTINCSSFNQIISLCSSLGGSGTASGGATYIGSGYYIQRCLRGVFSLCCCSFGGKGDGKGGSSLVGGSGTSGTNPVVSGAASLISLAVGDLNQEDDHNS